MKLIVALFLLTITACTTTPKKETVYIPPTAKEPSGSELPSIDYISIQRELHLDRPAEQLGYAEKSFNTCDMGYGYSKSQNCRSLYMVVLNVRLMCRDSEGTISTILTDADVSPIAGRKVRWNLKAVQGAVVTDNQGYGQIVAVSPRSERRERVKLAVGSEFLYMRANEITKVITPKPWCDAY
ncbi:MAG: hypothetical protein ACM3MG_02910 [Bacillota bacterium]